VDKTEYIAKLEQVNNPVFLRPRRFGKSFLCSMLKYYYDLNHKDEFEELFGDTWIGQNPTGQQNQYMILDLSFATVKLGSTIQDIEKSFRKQCNFALHMLRYHYPSFFEHLPLVDLEGNVEDNLQNLLLYIAAMDIPPLFVIIDEYDNFANQLILRYQEQLYRELTAEDGFLKAFFKVLKRGRETDALVNVYITGILPVTMDDLASAFNVATFLTLDPDFESMVGFTQDEVDKLLDEIFEEHEFPVAIRNDIDVLIKSNYDGYHFMKPSFDDKRKPIYNTTNLMYFLRYFTEHRRIPELLIDENLQTDLSWVKRLTASNDELTQEFVDQLTMNNSIQYDEQLLVEKLNKLRFNLSQFFDKSYFPVSFFYLGILTRQDDYTLRLPNLNIREMFAGYFNELYRIEDSPNYEHAMRAFIQQPDLEKLFRCYWEEYILQLPEAVFTKMNENFYRVTFYDLCNRYLARWFTWNVERSYPKGKSDLEFVGKYYEKFADMRWIIEFKYYSKNKMRKEKVDLKTFKLLDKDTKQVRSYVEGLKAEYPEARISQFVIYCFANQDFRVFQID